MQQVESLNRSIEEYYQLKSLKEKLEERIEKLNGQIKKNLIVHCGGTIRESVNYTGSRFEVELRVKTRQQLPDQGEIEQLFVDEGIWDKYKVEAIPESAVEEAYLSGDLSESALRSLKKESKYDIALHVKEVEERV